MSAQSRMSDLITVLGTDYKQLKNWMFGAGNTLASLTTTDKSSLIAAINETKAGNASVVAASETVSGVAEIATTAEMTAAVDDLRIVTPAKHKAHSDANYQAKSANLLALAAFTTSTDGALAANSDTVLATQKAVKAYADGLLDANNAYQYKGAIDCSTNPNFPAASAGHTYKVSVAGKIGGASGANVEAGDSLTCLVDGTSAGNLGAVGIAWIITQTNIDGAVVGPAVSVAANFSSFSGTTGKVIQDSGISLETSTALASDADTKVPSSKAVRAYIANTNYTKAEMGNPETDLAALYTAAKV